MQKNSVFTIAKYLFAIPLIIFGVNKFLLFFQAEPPTDPAAQLFMTGMFGSYLGKLVGIVEIIGGLLLLIPKTAFVGLLLLLPIAANIVAYHLSHDFPGNGIWLFTLVTALVVIIGHKADFQKLITG